MEVSGPINTSSCLDISGGSSTDSDHLTQDHTEGLSMNDLKTCLNVVFEAEDTESSTDELSPSPGKDYAVNFVKECECEGLEKIRTCSGKCLSKCASFPPLLPRSSVDAVIGEKEQQEEERSSVDAVIGEKEQQEEESGDVLPEVNGSSKPSNKCYSRSLSLPVPSRLVPAIKGSREKQGITLKNLSVTWAPDVYDPVPTSVSHVPSNRNQSYRSNSKRYGKSKQKSSSKSSSRSSSSKGKDKKQVRKSSSSSTRLKPFYEAFGASFSESQVESVDFDVGTPDPFCGSSFLKQSVRNIHFSVAEAT